MEDYKVLQTGDEIQEILNQAPVDTADIAELKEAATSLDGRLEAVEGKIPSGASSENPLTDKQYVDSSIASASATFRGTYNEVTDLELTTDATHADIGSALDEVIELADSNDYCFVQIPTDDETPMEIDSIERYKFVTGTGWEYEYTLNNSGFTADQWAAINSGITTGLVAKLTDLPTNAELNTLLNGKANAADVYTKSETYTKTELDTQLGAKANSADVYPKTDTYTKQEVDALITTPEVQYVTVTATSGTTSVTDVLPATGAANTIYRVGSWDGTQYDDGVYSEYSWNGSAYILLDVKNYGLATGSDFNNPTSAQRSLVTTVGSVLDGMPEGVFDVSARNSGSTWASLSALLSDADLDTLIPASWRKGGMTIRFVQTSDNKYVQYRYMETDATTAATFTNPANWQGVDESLIPDSDNLAKSGLVAEGFLDVEYGKVIREEQLTVVSGYYNMNGVRIGSIYSRPVSESQTTKCLSREVATGDVYEITGKGVSNYAGAYILTDSNHKVIDMVTVADYRTNPKTLYIEQPGYLYVNLAEYNAETDVVKEFIRDNNKSITGLDKRVSELEASAIQVIDNLVTSDSTKALSAKQGKVLDEKIDGTTTISEVDVPTTGTGKYINCNTATVGSAFNKTSTTSSSTGAAYWRIPVLRGEKYNIRALGTGSALALYVLTGENDIVLAKVGSSDTRETGLIIEIVEDGILYVNCSAYASEGGSLKKIETEITGGYKNYVDQKIADLEENSLKGKKIVFFGDSMVTVKDSNNKDVTNYIAEKTGAICLNFAIGGTRLAQRNTPTTTPNASTAWGDLDICNVVTAACTNDYQYVDAGAEVVTEGDVGDPIAQKIAAMKTLDWSTVDIIVLEGGGNDYSGGHYLGTADSFDKNNTLGAVNYIIQSVCTAFKKAKVTGLSNVVSYRAANSFNPETQYYTGDAVKYDSKIYVFLSDHLGAWTGEDVRLGTDADWRADDTWCDNAKNSYMNKTKREFIALIEQQYHYYHLPYANVYEGLGWNQYNFSEYFLDTDNHHPRKGLSQLADGIISHLENLVK